jgi:hypothetical protein
MRPSLQRIDSWPVRCVPVATYDCVRHTPGANRGIGDCSLGYAGSKPAGHALGCLGSRGRFVACVVATDVYARAGNLALNNRIVEGLGGAA